MAISKHLNLRDSGWYRGHKLDSFQSGRRISPPKRPCGREEFWIHAKSPLREL
jgi:hypothetical protein